MNKIIIILLLLIMSGCSSTYQEHPLVENFVITALAIAL